MGAPKKSRVDLDPATLSSEDRRALEHVARLLQRPVTELPLLVSDPHGPDEYGVTDGREVYLTPSPSDIQWTTTASQPSLLAASTALNQFSDMRRDALPFEESKTLRFDDSNAPSAPFAGEYRTGTASSPPGFPELQDFSMSQYPSHVREPPGDLDIQVMTGQSFDPSTVPNYLGPYHALDYPEHAAESTFTNFSENNSDQTGPLSADDPYWLSDQQDNQDSNPYFGTSASNSTGSWNFVEGTQNQEPEEVPSSLRNVAPQWIADQSIVQDSTPHRQQRQRRSFQDPHLREETCKTRQLNACVRCKMQKIRCLPDEKDPKGACRTCKAVSTQKIHTLDCLRYKISAVTLYRTGKAPGLEFTFRWPQMTLKDIANWQDAKVRTILVLSDVCPVPLELLVRRFEPIPQDSLKKSWMDGKVKKYKDTTPFAILNMTATVKTMKEFLDANIYICLKYFLDTREEFIKDTYFFAWNYRKRAPKEEMELLTNFFRLWVAIRRTATTEHIVGEDTLDMIPEKKDTSYPLFGKIPLPPVMIQQLDMILTLGILQPLRKRVLEDFQKLVVGNKPKSWMTIYLMTFMFLHSCGALSSENFNNARKHGLQRRYAMPTFISELHHGANVFLCFYHYCTRPCNPFTLDWKRRHVTSFADLPTEDIHFLLKSKEMIQQRADTFRRTKENELYEDDFYFVSQMFDNDWQPRDTVIDFDDGTVHGVDLKKYYG